MDYVKAINRLNDLVASAVSWAERGGLSKRKIADELRRIAAELESES